MNKSRLKFKKLLNEYRSEFYELQYVDEVIKDTNSEFEEYKKKYINKKRINIQSLNDKHQERIKKIFSPSPIAKAIAEKRKENPYNSKKIFRQIARRFHPDKLDSDDPRFKEYENVFKQATTAIDNKSWAELFNIAEKYDLDLDDYETMNVLLVKEIQLIKTEVINKKNTYAWLFYNCERDEDKDKLMKQFMKHIYIEW